MTRENCKNLFLASVLTFVFLSSIAITSVTAPANPTYTLGASPTTVNEEEGNVIITFTITGGSTLTAYTFRFSVAKPGGAGQAYVDESFTTNSTGGYTQVLTYPNNLPSWTPTSGTVQTDISGNYNVTVVETAPKSVTTGLPTTKFSVTSQLAVTIISPTQGSTVQRATTVNFQVTVYDVNRVPITDAQVSISSPGGGQVALSPSTPSGYIPDRIVFNVTIRWDLGTLRPPLIVQNLALRTISEHTAFWQPSLPRN